jgi:hypothetical protein
MLSDISTALLNVENNKQEERKQVRLERITLKTLEAKNVKNKVIQDNQKNNAEIRCMKIA